MLSVVRYRPALAIAIALLISPGTGVMGQSSQSPIVQWDLETRNGLSGEISPNSSIVVVGDLVSVSFSVNQDDVSNDENWELWVKNNGIWTLLSSGSISDDESLTVDGIGIHVNETGLHEIHLRLFPSSRTETINFHSDQNPLDLVPAGKGGVAVQGEPVHVGDYITLSALVHNRGDRTVEPHMELSSGSQQGLGPAVSIKPGSSKELEASLRLAEAGPTTIHWSISGAGIGVSHSLSGSIEVSVSPIQSIEISSVFHNRITNSLEIAVLLSEGRSRIVSISSTSTASDSNTQTSEIIANIIPGLQSISFPVPSDISGQVEVYAEPIGWFGDRAVEQLVLVPLASDATLLSELSPWDDGQSAQEVSISIRNSGTSTLGEGELEAIWVIDGRVISSYEIPSIEPSETYQSTVSFSKEGISSPGEIRLTYKTGSDAYSTTFQYVPKIQGKGGLDLPFQPQAAGIGGILGLVIVLLSVLIMRTLETEVSKTGGSKGENKKAKEDSIDCYNCGLILRIDNSRDVVRCPACSTINKLQVKMNIVEKQIETHAPPSPPDSAIATSSTDLISCPNCDQALKVPIDRRPVMARCPACKCTFKATKGE